MYIEKYWGNYTGGTDDSLTLLDDLTGKGKREIMLAEILAGTGLDRLNWDFCTTGDALRNALTDFCANPLTCDLHEMAQDEDMQAQDCPALCAELFAQPRRVKHAGKKRCILRIQRFLCIRRRLPAR